MNEPLFNEDDLKKMFANPSNEAPKPMDPSASIQIGFEPTIFPPKPSAGPSPIKPLPNIVSQEPKSTVTVSQGSSTQEAHPQPLAKAPVFQAAQPSYPAQLDVPSPIVKNKLPLFHPKLVDYLRTVVKYVIFFVLLFVISFTIINSKSLILQMKYFWATEYQNQDWTQTKKITATPAALENHLVIPKIAVDAPITWNVDPENINQPLENGVAQYKGTALPGQNGNVFIFGHSSYYIWAPGNYKEVFALLGKLDVGDKIYIYYQGNKYSYRIISKIVVKPDNVEVLHQNSAEKTLSLMTCVPVGTNLERLIVNAVQE